MGHDFRDLHVAFQLNQPGLLAAPHHVTPLAFPGYPWQRAN